MVKQQLLSWMEQMEHLCAVIGSGLKAGSVSDAASRALTNAQRMRDVFAADAACASVTDRPDTPPPSSWPSVSRIRKETRAEVVAEIVTHLRAEADKREQSVTTSSHQQMVYWFREAAAEIRARFG